VSGYADEVAALRGTRSATLRDLLTHPSFSRLLAAMSVSSPRAIAGQPPACAGVGVANRSANQRVTSGEKRGTRRK